MGKSKRKKKALSKNRKKRRTNVDHQETTVEQRENVRQLEAVDLADDALSGPITPTGAAVATESLANKSDNCIQGDKDEDEESLCDATPMGYFLLEQTEICLTHTGVHDVAVDWDDLLGHRVSSTWIDLELSIASEMSKSMQHHEINKPQQREGVADIPCPRCQFTISVTRTPRDSLVFAVDWDQVAAFSGQLEDRFCRFCRAKQSGSSVPRSDAALLMGAIALSHKLGGVVQVPCARMLLQHRCHVHDEESRSYARFDVALFVTISFPFLVRPSKDGLSKGVKSILPRAASSRFSPSTKLLHPAIQLLLTTIRSDWSLLENRLRNLQLKQNEQCVGRQPHDMYEPEHSRGPEHPNIFPVVHNLKELYKRIQGAVSLNSEAPGIPLSSIPMMSAEKSALLQLPHGVWMDFMAGYLTANEIHALRQTCSYLDDFLKGVIPGMRLRLYRHQLQSLLWMRTLESRRLTEDACLDLSPPATLRSYVQCPDNDLHRAATGGKTVLLRPWLQWSSSNPSSLESIRLETQSGFEEDAMKSLVRQGARGGLLVDEPGLGKTITVLSLVLQTYGLWSTRASIDFPNETDQTAAIFDAYWTGEVVFDFQRPLLLRLLNDWQRKARVGKMAAIERLRCQIGKGLVGGDFSAFELAVSNAIEEGALPEDASRIREAFNTLVGEFKNKEVNSARKSFSNANFRPNSSVALLIAKEDRERFLKSLVPSSATLIVVPFVLIDHWHNQMKKHINLKYLTDKQPLIFVFDKRDHEMTCDRATILCDLRKTHAPLIFIDRTGTRPLPPAEFLAKFKIVITSNQRFINEWKNGSFEDELKDLANGQGPFDLSSILIGCHEACSLLKVHWLRLVVDEGHSMAKGVETSSIQFASWITAERRWAMTGTPTKHTKAQLAQLLGLIRFIQHQFFTSRLDGDKFWRQGICRGWKDGTMASFFRLRALLSFLMKRHTKMDIEELPRPVYRTSLIDMSYAEATTYNTLVAGAQSNILITSMEGVVSGLQDSLLHRSQAKHARTVLTNIRRVCVGWSRVAPTLSEQHWAETLRYARITHQLPNEAVAKISSYLHAATAELLTPCDCCSLDLSTLLLLPCCASLVCTECLADDEPSFDVLEGSNVIKCKYCIMCKQKYNVDQFQLFQPGFVLNWKQEAPRQDPNADQPGFPLGQLVARRDESSIIIRPQNPARRRKKIFGDGHDCIFDKYAIDGKCTLCLHDHQACNFLNNAMRCETCYKLGATCPDEESKAHALVKRLETLLVRHGCLSCDGKRSYAPSLDDRSVPLKVVVFSQFREALNTVGSRLLNRFGTACVAEYWGRFRTAELHKFTNKAECFCLLLTKDGSEGLDLSFVTYIFFLEEIWDKALEEQAVARAWRMGATRQVQVETLLAKNSVEVTMRQESQCLVAESEQKLTELEHRKTENLLKSLRLVTDYASFRKSRTGDASGIGTFVQAGADPIPTVVGVEALQKDSPFHQDFADVQQATKQPSKHKKVRFYA